MKQFPQAGLEVDQYLFQINACGRERQQGRREETVLSTLWLH